MLFRIHHHAAYGDRLVLLGSTTPLGKWDRDRALPATWTPNHVWTVSTVPRPRVHAPSRFEFKALLITASGALVWEPGPNHVAHLPAQPSLPIVISVSWGQTSNLEIPANPPRQLSTPPPTPRGAAPDVDDLALTSLALTHATDGGGRLRLRIKYRLEHGERVYVMGSIPELGEWDKAHAPRMEREDTDMWQIEMVVPRDEEHERFEYKYFTRKADGTRRWEGGENRVAKPFVEQAPREGDAVLCDDRWEKTRFEFSIYYPTKPGQTMHVTGDPKEIGGWFKPGPTRMLLGAEQMLETDVKGRKWHLKTWMPTSQAPFSYRYIVVDSNTKAELWEREPNRRAEFDPEESAINGVHILKDVNFVSGLSFDPVPPDMYIGPYPQTVGDVDAMAEGGVTGVFNVQTDEDFKHRAIQWDVLLKRYKSHNIKVVRYPIRDFDRNSLQEHLHGATHALDKLLREGRKVYIHCTAGMGRAPACAVAYLCWVKGMDLAEAVSHVKRYRKVAVPNVPVLEQALKQPY